MIDEDNKTLWCGNLPEQATEELLYELFLQAGPLEKVRIAKDRDGRQKAFAFITYCHEASVPYALNLFRGTALFHKTLTLQSRGRPALLPPPIRCVGPDPNIDFHSQGNVAQEFANMMDRLNEEQFNLMPPRTVQESNDKLVLASLQGNWTHRHHPYRPDKPHGRDDRDYRARDNHNDNYKANNRNKHNNWRDRRNHKKNYR